MTIRSMTGYGGAKYKEDGFRLEVECKSVNGKSRKVYASVPSDLLWLESEIEARARRFVGRGRVDIDIKVSWDVDGQIKEGFFIDQEAFELVADSLKSLAERMRIGPVDVSDVLEFRELLERDPASDLGESRDRIIEVVDEALADMVESRRSEGRRLERKLRGLLDQLEDGLTAIQSEIDSENKALNARFMERVQKVIESHELGQIDSDRLKQEIAVAAEKRDISEELQRIESHLQALRETLDDKRQKQPESAEPEGVGKTIDFYLQELIREVNTVCSKVDSADLTDRAIDMKSTIEKLREQAANIE